MHYDKIHIHIENSRSSPPVFIADGSLVRQLLEHNLDLADRLHITIGSSAHDEVDRWTEGDLEEFYTYMKTADVLVGYSFPVDDLAKHAPNLRWIHFISSGVEHLAPFDWVPEGVTLVNNRGVHLPKSGESFAMFLGMLNAQIPRLVTAQRNGKWDRVFTSIIVGKTLVIYGVGHQGGEIARQAVKMGLHVIGVDPYVTTHPSCVKVVTPDNMKEVFAGADFLAIAAPLTDATRGIISEEVLGWLPAHAGVMNVSRGPLLDQEALHRKLSAGELSGAILDVFDIEPLPEDSILWTTPNLIITPHVSSDDLVNYMPLTLELTLKNVRNELEGHPFKNIVNTNKAF